LRSSHPRLIAYFVIQTRLTKFRDGRWILTLMANHMAGRM
jgi:hypothetical protein